MKKINPILVAAAILLTVGVWLIFGGGSKKVKQAFHHPYDFQGPCPGATKTETMNDPYLRGILDQGKSYNYTESWYWCNPVERGDIVVLKYAQDRPAVVRQVVGIPGDEFSVFLDSEKKQWGLQIGKEKIKMNDQLFLFGVPEAKPPLKLFEESHDGILGEREIIVLSAFPPGDSDSSVLGAVNLNDVLGKVLQDKRH